jgi:pyruvate-ferredoxin/flavodoxin oxidoreductase
VGLKNRANTVLQTCFFALSRVLPRDQAIAQIKHFIRKTYGSKGESVVQQNFNAVDATLSQLHEVRVPAEATSTVSRPATVPATAPEFVQLLTARMLEGLGDQIPVSLMPVDGTWPSGTAAWEKRNIAEEVPVLDRRPVCAMRPVQFRVPA